MQRHIVMRNKSVKSAESAVNKKKEVMRKETWKAVIQVIITILTAISSTVLVQSCGLCN